jgi:hypothetical protein
LLSACFNYCIHYIYPYFVWMSYTVYTDDVKKFVLLTCMIETGLISISLKKGYVAEWLKALPC